MAKVMLLGGARETGRAATALLEAGHAVQVHWSRDPVDVDLPRCDTLRSGLGWADGVLDTTHVFDRDTRLVAAHLAPGGQACRFGRALWTAEPGDRWTYVAHVAAGVAALPTGARVFAATGRDSAEVLGHHDGPVFLRQLQHHDDPAPANCTFVFGAGPFDAADEAHLLEDLGIEVVLARNVGGTGSFPKIAAARRLGLAVVLIQPDAWEFGAAVTSLDAVLEWAAAL